MTEDKTCANCGQPIYYSPDDVNYLHRHGGGYWCDAVRYDIRKGYVNTAGESVFTNTSAPRHAETHARA